MNMVRVNTENSGMKITNLEGLKENKSFPLSSF